MQLFFGLLALTMLGVKYKGDKRDQYLQHGGWFVKMALWIVCNALPFFLPASVVNSYGERGLSSCSLLRLQSCVLPSAAEVEF